MNQIHVKMKGGLQKGVLAFAALIEQKECVSTQWLITSSRRMSVFNSLDPTTRMAITRGLVIQQQEKYQHIDFCWPDDGITALTVVISRHPPKLRMLNTLLFRE